MKREYGIDVLKMMAMMMVVAHHVLQGGGVETSLVGRGQRGMEFFEQIFHCFCYCAVDVFVMATGYIMCRLGFKYTRIVKLWRQVVGYSLVLCIVAMALGFNISWRDWANACFPVLTNQYWFFTQYFALFFTIPFLNRLVDGLSERETKILLGSGFGLLSCMSLIAGKDLFVTKWGYCWLWFMYLYLLGASIHKLNLVTRVARLQAGIALGVGCVISAAGAVGSHVLPKLVGGGARVGDFAYSYTSPSILLEALSLMILFGKMEVKSERLQKWVAFLAPSTFIVYVVHSNGIFRQMTGWKSVFLPLADYGWTVSVFGAALTGICLFVGIVTVDSLRRVICSRFK